MPLTQIFFKGDRSENFRRAVSDGVHRAMVEAYNVPASGKFHVVTQVKDDAHARQLQHGVFVLEA